MAVMAINTGKFSPRLYDDIVPLGERVEAKRTGDRLLHIMVFPSQIYVTNISLYFKCVIYNFN